MEMEKISKYVGNQSMSIVDAMAKIDANTKGILFIVDDNQTLVGALTDGDIRRWILNSGEVSAAVSCAAGVQFLLEHHLLQFASLWVRVPLANCIVDFNPADDFILPESG